MNAIQRLSACFFIASALIGSGLHAQQAPLPYSDAPPAILIENIANFREAYLAQLFGPFRAAVGSGPGLTADDVRQAGQLAAANARAQALLVYFSADLDGDGQVTLDEYKLRQRRFWPSQPNDADDDPVLRQFRDMDANGDGVVTFDEAMAAAIRTSEARGPRPPGDDRLAQLMALDPNHDGLLTGDELERLGRAAFAFYDRDGNGALSVDERRVVSADAAMARQANVLRQQFARCMFPQAEARDDVFLIDAYRAQALSSVSLVGQDKVTETAEIAIEPGDTPLYVIAFGRAPIVWRVTGAVGRVRQFVAASNVSAVGVIGLPKTAVILSPNMDCVGNQPTDSATVARQTVAALERAIGRPLRGIVNQGFFRTQLPSGATATADMGNVRIVPAPIPLPGGQLPPPPAGLDAASNAALWRYHPGGYVQIDAEQVMATGPVVAYDVPPMEAGLIKLMVDGAISQIGPRSYLVNRPIARMPAGLSGPGAVHFSLAAGVAPPPGYPRLMPGPPQPNRLNRAQDLQLPDRN